MMLMVYGGIATVPAITILGRLAIVSGEGLPIGKKGRVTDTAL